MINSEPTSAEGDVGTQQEADMNATLRSGARGAVVLASLATAIVVAIWFAFYLLVFVPRAMAP
jgi:hypothetical protein